MIDGDAPKSMVPVPVMGDGLTVIFVLFAVMLVDPPPPLNVHVVPVQDTPEPENVNAPVFPLMDETPPLLVPQAPEVSTT